MTSTPREALITKLKQLPRYTEYHVRRRPSTNEYLDAEQVDELLTALSIEVSSRHEDEQKEPQNLSRGEPSSQPDLQDPRVVPNQLVPTWQPMETAPKDGTSIVVNDGKWTVIARSQPKRSGWYSVPGKYPVNAERWMPLPSPPLAEKKDA